jgi:DNA invertase Pin-like site-specific DNA recombinase
VPTTLIDFQGQDWIRDMVNNILIEVMSSMAQNEREKIHDRQREGIAAMQVVNGKKVSAKKGSTYGRQPIELADDFEKFLKKQKDGEMTVAECCEQLNISRRTWYNRVSEVG